MRFGRRTPLLTWRKKFSTICKMGEGKTYVPIQYALFVTIYSYKRSLLDTYTKNYPAQHVANPMTAWQQE